MTYYAIYNKTNDTLTKAQVKCLNVDCVNIEVSKDIYDNLDRYIYDNGQIVENPNYEEEQANARRQQFNNDFFKTSLGYIRRKVSMATGETKDFLSDLLPTISMGVQMGKPIQIIAYKEPDFTTDEIDWVRLQEDKTVTAEFVQECFLQLSNDFKPVEV